ncbi:MAG: toll/interleukin-1 receptor domain-containing protein [Clostridiales bacterium]|nr:toll/interleukin-1 receptor domain-containing protein [Clostridiales bacterium]
MENYHVLVLAMSTLNSIYDEKEKKVRSNGFRFRDDGGKEYVLSKELLGQLEVMPVFLTEYFNTDISHIIILETEKTQKEAKLRGGANHPWRKIVDSMVRDGQTPFRYEDGEQLSAVEFFKRRIETLCINGEDGKPPIFIDLTIDEEDPEEGLESLLKEIRGLYADCRKLKADWKLWLDIHGGFREISLAMFSLMQVLSVVDMKGIPQLKDGNGLIPVTNVYTTEYDNDIPISNIVEKTDFFRSITGPALTAYMNYGQYVQSILKPYEGSLPYAFVSYKHQDAEKERVVMMCLLKEAGYRYWYDDGIHLGDDWKQTLEEKLEKAVVVLIFLTEHYKESYQCLKELRQAMDQGKEIILVSLDEKAAIYDPRPLEAMENGQKIVITGEEKRELAARQQIDLKAFIQRGEYGEVLQRESLTDRWKESVGMSLARACKNGFEGGSFVNISNHPSDNWGEEQRRAAEEMGTIVDIPFPLVDPYASEENVEKLADQIVQETLTRKPAAVMCQGEFTLTEAIVRKLRGKDIPVYSACTQRVSKERLLEDGSTAKESVFTFVKFRRYGN